MATTPACLSKTNEDKELAYCDSPQYHFFFKFRFVVSGGTSISQGEGCLPPNGYGPAPKPSNATTLLISSHEMQNNYSSASHASQNNASEINA